MGHPYETQELFNETYELAKKINFSKIHVFPYSLREGTASSKMKEQVKEEIKKSRAKKLGLLSDKLEQDYYDKFIGKNVDVLIETVNDEESIGHTSNYLMVKLPEKLEVGKIYSRVL